MADFDFPKWLKKMTYWEDADTQLIFISTEDGWVEICNKEFNYSAHGKTLEEACLAFEKVARARGESGLD